MHRFALCGMDMCSADYDGRTALHLAAAEGHLPVVRLLIEKCHVPNNPRDRSVLCPFSVLQFEKKASLPVLPMSEPILPVPDIFMDNIII